MSAQVAQSVSPGAGCDAHGEAPQAHHLAKKLGSRLDVSSSEIFGSQEPFLARPRGQGVVPTAQACWLLAMTGRSCLLHGWNWPERGPYSFLR